MRADVEALSFSAVVPSTGTEWPLVPSLETSHAHDRGVAALSVSDAAPPADANADRPAVMRSRFTCRVGTRSLFFHVDRSLTAALRAGDVVHVATTSRGGVGMSVVREHQLVAAVGVVSAVPMDADVSVRVAPECWEGAIALVGPQPGTSVDPRRLYRHEQPLEICIKGRRYLWFVRNQTIQGFHVFVKHGFLTRSSFGARAATDECVSLARIDVCPRVAATTSAYLLAADGCRDDRQLREGPA